MEEVALGTAVLNRTGKLEKLLHSAENTGIQKIYVADNGRIDDERENLYQSDFSFDLEVLDLEYDVGLGHCRDEIVKAVDEDFLLMADSDHQISNNLDVLVEILSSEEELGGVSGTIVEPGVGRIWQSAKDFRLVDNTLVRGADIKKKDIDTVEGWPIARFDFVPYPCLYRMDCLNDYSWDKEIKIGFAHADFYFQHWQFTDWSFAVCPEVCFRHYPGGDSSYISERENDKKTRRARERFLNKNGLSDFRMEQAFWFDTESDSPLLKENAISTYKMYGIVALISRGFSKIRYNIRKNIN
jgi:hypothetical protein